MSLMSHRVDSQISSQFSWPFSPKNLLYHPVDRRVITSKSLYFDSRQLQISFPLSDLVLLIRH
jgi:hypothetical protein